MQDYFLMNFADFLTFQATLTELGENFEDGWMDQRLNSLEHKLVYIKNKTQR